MTLEQIARRRLVNQRLAAPHGSDPAAIVAWLGAVQAQEYAAAKWALGLRMADGATDRAIERAIDDGRILRTHVLRPTWHFVAAEDIRWMLELTAPRVHQAHAYANRYYELAPGTRTRAAAIFERALSRGEHLTRAELGAALARAGIRATGIRLALLTIYAELEGVMCSGRRRGAQQTYALLSLRAPAAGRLPRDEALAELTRRCVGSHGPMTIRDYTWWSGLTVADARRGLAAIGAQRHDVAGLTYWSANDAPAGRGVPAFPPPARSAASIHLLPIYDEYLVAYRDHHAVPRPATSRGGLPQAMIARGQVVGTWKAVRAGAAVTLAVESLRTLTLRERRALARAATRYGRFADAPVSIRVT